jgi:hypothetical protein
MPVFFSMVQCLNWLQVLVIRTTAGFVSVRAMTIT